MKPPVSLDYVIVIALLACASAVLSFVAPHPGYNLTALIVGVYAMHLVSLRVVLRQYAGVPLGRFRGGKRDKSGSAEDVLEIRELREQLELERREVENRKAELGQRIEAAEQQWELLRQMIRDRVGEGSELPDGVTGDAQTAWTAQPSAAQAGREQDVQPRVHGRW